MWQQLIDCLQKSGQMTPASHTIRRRQHEARVHNVRKLFLASFYLVIKETLRNIFVFVDGLWWYMQNPFSKLAVFEMHP